MEELETVYLAEEHCFMRQPSKVWKLLDATRYAERWPLIGLSGELDASAVEVATTHKGKAVKRRVLMHKRRVNALQAAGVEPVLHCADCTDAFQGDDPHLCKYSLANDLWAGKVGSSISGC